MIFLADVTDNRYVMALYKEDIRQDPDQKNEYTAAYRKYTKIILSAFSEIFPDATRDWFSSRRIAVVGSPTARNGRYKCQIWARIPRKT
jgi:hypothetical protein